MIPLGINTWGVSIFCSVNFASWERTNFIQFSSLGLVDITQCIVFSNFQQRELYYFQIPASALLVTHSYNFRKFQPQHSLKKSVASNYKKSWGTKSHSSSHAAGLGRKR